MAGGPPGDPDDRVARAALRPAMTRRDAGVEALDLFPPEPVPDRPIVVGTSGYSFPDWIGPFYPPGIRAGDQLPFYARHFSAVEVNVTYYRLPDARMLHQMERK